MNQTHNPIRVVPPDSNAPLQAPLPDREVHKLDEATPLGPSNPRMSKSTEGPTTSQGVELKEATSPAPEV